MTTTSNKYSNKIRNSILMIAAITVFVAFLLIYEDFKSKHINDYFFGKHSSRNYNDYYSNIDLNIKQLSKYNNFLENENCRYRLSLKEHLRFLSKSEKDIKMQKLNFQMTCKNDVYNFFHSQLIPMNDFEYKDFEFIYFSKFNEFYAKNDDIQNTSKETLEKLLKTKNLQAFLENIENKMEQLQEKNDIINDNIASWN